MVKKKIVILVLSYDQGVWGSIEKEGIRKTWGSVTHPDIEILYYYGGSTFKRDGDRLYFPHVESYKNIGHKTVDAFKYVQDHYDFDFIFRTNTSSYVDQINLVKHLSQYDPNKDLYSGVKCVPPPKDKRPVFASGCGYSLSRTTVSKILEDRGSWNHEVIDDNALAWLMIKHGIPVTNAHRFDMTNPKTWEKFGFLAASRNFHVRCKGELWVKPKLVMHREWDVQSMALAHRVYHELRNPKGLVSYT